MAGRDSPTVIAKDEISKDNAQAKNIPQNTMGRDEHPEDNASWVSKLMVFWINPLIAKAGQRQLSFEDVWATPSNQSVQHDSKVVWDAWEIELNHALVEKRVPSLTQALYMGFKRDFHIAGGLQAVFMFSQIVQPYLVGELVNYIQFGNGGLSYGAGISVALLIISLISSMSFTAGFSILRRMGVSMRSGVMMAVYEKALKLTSASRMQNSIGQTTNLMSIDAEKLFLSVQFLHFIWHGPVANVLVMLLIIQDVGVGPGLLGLASQLALLPIQNYLAECIGRVRREMVKHTDERVKLMNEILQAIRVIKMYAWEGPMEQRIVDVRRKELKCLNLYLSLNSCLRELLFVAGPIASVVVFTSLIYGFGQSITLTEMFRVTAFINILRLPSTLLGQALKNVGDARVSAARLTRFFQSPTLPESSVGQMSTTPQISLKNASFRWETVAVDVQKDTTERTFIQMINSKILSRNSTAGTEDDTKEKKGSAHGADDDDVIREDDTLKNINFSSSSAGELIALIGSVGSGKSSLMSALLKEIPLTGGSSSLDGKVAYCAQTPWIQNLSLKDNILFGLDINDPGIASAYEEAINAAALKPDITILPDGDLTEIGERGINLSGGQKARVSIARAILASREAQIVLLDDPFSAVDGSTGNWIFEHGVMGILEGRLRIIALNSHRHLLSRFDRIIVMDNGRIVADGSPTELPQELLFGMEGLGPSNRSPSSNLLSELMKTDISVIPTSSAVSQIGTAEAPPSPHFETLTEETTRGRSLSSAKIDHIQSTDEAEAVTRIASKLIVAEERKVGDVSLHVYNKYFGSAFSASVPLFNESGDDNSASKSYTFTCFQTIRSISLMLGLIFMFASAQFVRVAVDYSLARWANYGGTVHGSKLNNSWNTAYFITVGVLFFFLAGRASFLNLLALLSAKHIHEDLFRTVLCAPVTSFFDTHTMGEVLNRFAKDTEIVDSSVPEFLMQALTNWMQIFSVFALSLYATPYFAIVLFPLLIGFYHVYVKFGAAQRDLKRLEAVSRSPVYASLSESLSGLETIRAYGATDRFLRTHMKRMAFNQKFFFHLWMCTSWLTARLEISTSLILFSISILCVSLRSEISPVALGLALTYGLQLNALFQRVVQVTIDVQSYMISSERIFEYCEIDPEPSTVNPFGCMRQEGNVQLNTTVVADPEPLCTPSPPTAADVRFTAISKISNSSTDAIIVPVNWPSQGIVRFENVWMQYRDNPAVLRGISFSTLPAMRIGICGRTGAGKSSLMIALLRMSPLMSGAIYLDDLNIATVPLFKLRSAVAIIPQDPVLFTGTIRFQLDPFCQYSDGNIWDVLEQVRMVDFVRSTPSGLGEEVLEGGENLSQGQRQLLCIARSLLRKTRVLIMDEGTSAVDPQTDELIQKVLRDNAMTHGTTVLTIAHRLETIIDFDRILVLGAGEVLEYDTPAVLLANKDSVFSSMILEHAGATHTH